MALLMLFALVAGAGTALSPCVLPVLPALLGAGLHRRAPPPGGYRARPGGHLHGHDRRPGERHRRRRAGAGADADAGRRRPHRLRHRGGVPSLAARLEAPLARLSRLGPRSRGDGFASGLLVGAALGFVYAPCAGPILAAVIAVGAASSRTVPVGLAFALGSALVLLALSLGGRALAGRVRATGRGPGLQRALARRPHPHRRRHGGEPRRALPVGHRRPPARRARQPDARPRDLARRRQPARRPARPVALRGRGHRAQGVEGARLPRLGAAPDFTGNQRWFNTPGGSR